MPRTDEVDRVGHAPAGVRPTALVGIDFEDWHALTAERFGGAGGDRSPALERQTDRLLDLLEAVGATNILLVDPNASLANLRAFAREVMPALQSDRSIAVR